MFVLTMNRVAPTMQRGKPNFTVAAALKNQKKPIEPMKKNKTVTNLLKNKSLNESK